LLVGLSAVVLTFEGSYKNKPAEPQVNVSWLPGYSANLIFDEQLKKSAQIRSSLYIDDQTRFVGTSNGLVLLSGGVVSEISGMIGFEVRSLARNRTHLFIGSKKGLFAMELPLGEPVLLLKKDIHHIDIQHDSLIAAADNKNLYTSTNYGSDWQTSDAGSLVVAAFSNMEKPERVKKIPLHRFVLDVHTGKAFLGKSFEWVWILLVGLSVTILTFTGMLMWFRKQRKKSAAVKSHRNRKQCEQQPQNQ
jgi:hypothetical protein